VQLPLQAPRSATSGPVLAAASHSPHAIPKRAAPDHSRARLPGDTFRISDSQIFGLSLKPTWSRVVGGLWFGKFFTESSDLDLDHVIPLEWAHSHGDWRWAAEQKQLFANDCANLILVGDGRNQSKGSRGPGEWLPGNTAPMYSGGCI
jgi:hypothetical protein